MWTNETKDQVLANVNPTGSKGGTVKTLTWMSWWSDHIKLLYPLSLPNILSSDAKCTRQNAGNGFDSLSLEDRMLWIQAQIFGASGQACPPLKTKKLAFWFIQKSLANFTWVDWASTVLCSLWTQTKPSFLPYKTDYNLRISLRYHLKAQPASLCSLFQQQPLTSAYITHLPPP